METTNRSVIVKNNAPGWPAMVKNDDLNHSKRNSYEKLKFESLGSAASSIWSESQNKSNLVQLDNVKDISDASMLVQKSRRLLPEIIFAPKPRLVRQCEKCQILYQNCHKCLNYT